MTCTTPAISTSDLAEARCQLSCFVRSEADATADELGFGWRPARRPPTTFDELQMEFQACHASGLPVRVSRDHSDETVYDQVATNWAMRFVHDSRHVWLGADFSTESELAVASCHLARAKATGLGPGTLAYALLLADTVGQTLFVAKAHRFVVHQLDFALDCIRFDLDTAIQYEVRRTIIEGSAS